MEIIRLPGYTELEKLNIAKQFLVIKQSEGKWFDTGKHYLYGQGDFDHYQKLYQRGGRPKSGAGNRFHMPKSGQRSGQKGTRDKITVKVQSIQKYLGVPKFRYGRTEEKDSIGLTTGLAWTDVGGELLQTEASVMPGKGNLSLTGKLGEVMQESARAALSYVRSKARALRLPDNFYEKIDIHIHVPEGAIPKDGPSAGVTIATSIVSALTRYPVRHDIAMTGEITLRGRVLPIGGLKEKIIAAHRGDVSKVFIPMENKKDIAEIPKKILRKVELIPVEHADDVLKEALIVEEGEALFEAEADIQPFCFSELTAPEKEVEGTVTAPKIEEIARYFRNRKS
jgi:ATP-dependent Lon protease